MPGPALDPADHSDRYRSLSSFYLADPRRIGSHERDLGQWWRIGAHGPVYRAAWLRETGELYAARLGPITNGEYEVQVLGQAGAGALEEALAGWADVCPQLDSMTWLRHRARRLEQPATPRVISSGMSHSALTGRRVSQAKAAFAHLENGAHRGHAHRTSANRSA